VSDFATGAGTFSFLNKLKWQQLGRLRRAAIDSSDQCQKPQSESPRRRRYKASERSAQQLSQELGVSVWSLKRWSKERALVFPPPPKVAEALFGDEIGVQKVRTYKQNRHLGRRESVFDFVLPFCAGFNARVVPDGELLAHQGL
jgi:hypothetical protein